MKALLKDFEQAVGRTISDIRYDYGGYVAFHFGDDEALVLCASPSYDSTDLRIEEEMFANDPLSVSLGLIPREEYDLAMATVKEANAQREKQRERDEYLRLKKKFEAG